MVRYIFKTIGLLHICLPLVTPSTLWSTQYLNDVCTCPCSTAHLNLSVDAAVTREEALEKSVEIQHSLTVDKRTTSSVNRTKTSQADPRSTSKSIGVVSVVFICLVFAVICLSDVISCFRLEQVRPKKKSVRKKPLRKLGGTDNTCNNMRRIKDVTNTARSTEDDITTDINVSQSRRSTDDDITMISYTSHTLGSSGVNIHTLAIGKLLFSASKSLFHFPVWTHSVEGTGVSLSSFTSAQLSEPLLPSPPRSRKLFRRSVAKDANLNNI